MAGNPVELRVTMDVIDENPELWNQYSVASRTDCGTAHCFGGWTLVRKGYRLTPGSLQTYCPDGTLLDCPRLEKAAEILGLAYGSDWTEALFFNMTVDRAEMRALVEAIIAGDHEMVERYL